MMCRVMNPTSTSVTWPAGHAIVYLTPFDVNAVGVHFIDVTDCITQNRQHTPDVENQNEFTMNSIVVLFSPTCPVMWAD